MDRKFYGLASGSVWTMRLLGMMVSMGIATVILTLWMGRVRMTPQVYPFFVTCARLSFLIFFVLCFFGIFFSLARGRVRGKGM